MYSTRLQARHRDEVKLFKRNKEQKWFGDLVNESKEHKTKDKKKTAAKGPKTVEVWELVCFKLLGVFWRV